MNLNNEAGYTEAAMWFRKISEYKDADPLSIECDKKAEDAHKDLLYNKACEIFNDSHYWAGKKPDIQAHEQQ